MRAIIERGYLYIARPPLYKIKKNKVERYVHNEDEFEDFILDLGLEDITIEKVAPARYKEILGISFIL